MNEGDSGDISDPLRFGTLPLFFFFFLLTFLYRVSCVSAYLV